MDTSIHDNHFSFSDQSWSHSGIMRNDTVIGFLIKQQSRKLIYVGIVYVSLHVI